MSDLIDLAQDDLDDEESFNGASFKDAKRAKEKKSTQREEDEEVIVIADDDANGSNSGQAGARKRPRSSSTLDALLAAQLAADDAQDAPKQQKRNANGAAKETSRETLAFAFEAEPGWNAAEDMRTKLEDLVAPSPLVRSTSSNPTTSATKAILCEARPLRLFRQTRRWSCGYSSLQMVLSGAASVAPGIAQSALMGSCGHVPSLLTIQRAVTAAWKHGFDPEGAQQFSGSLVNKARWIGTTEITSAMRACGIPCTIHTFEGSQAGTGVLEFARKTFDRKTQGEEENGASPRICPLYLQWEGHSCVIVGVETLSTSDKPIAIYVLDPGARKRFNTLAQWRKSARRLESSMLKRDAYEVVQVYDPLSPSAVPFASLDKQLAASSAFKS